jgi:hypothetical protein
VPLSGLLRDAHRCLGVAEQRLASPRRDAHSHPDAEAELDQLPAEAERHGEHLVHPVADGARLSDVGHVLAAQGEPVAADPRDHVAKGGDAGDEVGDGPEHLVAGDVADRFVQGLEVVDVEGNRGGDARAPCIASQCPVELLEEHLAVRVTGEAVVARHEGEVGLERAAVADVDGGAHRAVEPDGIVVEALHGRLDRHHRAVGTPGFVLALRRIMGGGIEDHPRRRVRARRPDVRAADWATECLGSAVAEDGRGPLVPVDDRAALVGDDDRNW